jgi:hypothetical protein
MFTILTNICLGSSNINEAFNSIICVKAPKRFDYPYAYCARTDTAILEFATSKTAFYKLLCNGLKLPIQHGALKALKALDIKVQTQSATRKDLAYKVYRAQSKTKKRKLLGRSILAAGDYTYTLIEGGEKDDDELLQDEPEELDEHK